MRCVFVLNVNWKNAASSWPETANQSNVVVTNLATGG